MKIFVYVQLGFAWKLHFFGAGLFCFSFCNTMVLVQYIITSVISQLPGTSRRLIDMILIVLLNFYPSLSVRECACGCVCPIKRTV